MIQHTQITPYNGAKVNFELLKTPDGKLGMANAEVGIFVLVTVGMTLPVVPHKAVAEVSRIGNYRRDWLL